MYAPLGWDEHYSAALRGSTPAHSDVTFNLTARTKKQDRERVFGVFGSERQTRVNCGSFPFCGGFLPRRSVGHATGMTGCFTTFTASPLDVVIGNLTAATAQKVARKLHSPVSRPFKSRCRLHPPYLLFLPTLMLRMENEWGKCWTTRSEQTSPLSGAAAECETRYIDIF